MADNPLAVRRYKDACLAYRRQPFSQVLKYDPTDGALSLKHLQLKPVDALLLLPMIRS